MQASTVSHSSAWLPSISSSRSPRSTPAACSQAASWLGPVGHLAVGHATSEPSASTTRSAGRLRVGSVAATWSNQSSAQLNCSGRGGRNCSRAPRRSPRAGRAAGRGRPGSSRSGRRLGVVMLSDPGTGAPAGQREPARDRQRAAAGSAGQRLDGQAEDRRQALGRGTGDVPADERRPRREAGRGQDAVAAGQPPPVPLVRRGIAGSDRRTAARAQASPVRMPSPVSAST